MTTILSAMGWMLLGAIAGAVAVYALTLRDTPPLGPWHHNVVGTDFTAGNAGESLSDYLAREDLLFETLASLVESRGRREAGAIFNRYSPTSPSNPQNYPRNWNRSYEFEVDAPRGGVLLVHGLSDSPYSTRALGRLFAERGFYALGLRMPGHGTVPGALTATRWSDWGEAFRLGARHVARRVGEDRPFYIVGYSNGAALAIDYTLGALEGSGDPRPTELILLSPAVAVTRLASLARFQRRIAVLPKLEKLAWSSIRPEYDPFKYTSFAVRAGEEIYELTGRVDRHIERLAGSGALAPFPPVLVFQSVVDSTIPPQAIVDRLLAKLEPADSELVLFDVNRRASEELFQGTAHDAFLDRLVGDSRLSFALTLVTNEAPGAVGVVARRRAMGESVWTERSLGLEWPRGVYSLSHVAIPFPPSDPVYGVGEGSGPGSTLNLGGLQPRGERGLLALPIDQLMRLRYNPFFDYLEERVAERLAARGASSLPGQGSRTSK
jgi:alpha-beta hydrolase superfamily lysophospholipase